MDSGEGFVVAVACFVRELARVRVLAESVRAHAPGAAVVVVVADDPGRGVDAASEPFELIHADDLLDPQRLAALRRLEDPARVAAEIVAVLAGRVADRGTPIVVPAAAVFTRPIDPEDPTSAWVLADDADPDHLAALARHGHGALVDMPVRIGILESGDIVGAVASTALPVYRRAVLPAAQSHAGFLEWLRHPEPRRPGARFGVGRFLYGVWSHRPDLQRMYPDLDGDDGPLLIEWAWRYGKEFDGLPEALLPDRPDPSALARPVEDPPSRLPVRRQVNVIGLLERELGLGEAARHLVAALDAVGVPLLPIEVPSIVAPVRASAVGSALAPRHAAFPVNIVCLNGPALNALVEEAGADFLADRPSIGVWFWEVGVPPKDWFEQVHLLDELWVSSSFVADALSPALEIPVVVVPQAVEVAEVLVDRSVFGVEDDAFVFLFAFDFNSDVFRKNPFGVIEAYERAFPEGGSTALVLKSMNGDRHPAALDELRVVASRRRDVRIIEGALPPEARDALIAGCDCYVSLHRSEGFGLTMAEAMLHTRPVIATRYGGNLEFMDDETSWLIDVEVVAVPAGSLYAESGFWGEPDLDQAAAAMRAVVADPAAAAIRAEAGRAKVAATLAPAVVGSAMVDHLERHWRAGGAAPDAPWVDRYVELAAELASASLAEARQQRRRMDALAAHRSVARSKEDVDG